MLVSVIIPTFNRSALLQKAVQSALAQSYTAIEVIVVDDGSTDDTPDVVARSAKETDRLIYIRKSNGGCASARNMGLAAATGDFFIFLDSDDAWEPDAVETLVQELTASEADLVYSPSIEVFQDGSELINCPVAADQPEILAVEHFKSTNVRPGSFMFTRKAYEHVGGHDESLLYNEDSDFFQRLAIFCRAIYSSIPTVRHLHHDNNKSSNRVEIYKALLKSSQNVLRDNPAFAARLGRAADARLQEIKTNLVEALIATGAFAEANAVAREIANSLRLNVKLALLIKTNVLLRLEGRVRRAVTNRLSFLRSRERGAALVRSR